MRKRREYICNICFKPYEASKRCKACPICTAKKMKEYGRNHYLQHKDKQLQTARDRYKQRKIDEPWHRFLHHTKSSRGFKYKDVKRLLTSEDLKLLWFRDKAYEMKRPSIDRIDSKGDYILDNCQFLELSENIAKGNRERDIKHKDTWYKRKSESMKRYYAKRRESALEVGKDLNEKE